MFFDNYLCLPRRAHCSKESLSEEQREAGRMPRTVEVELTRDLADTASPGDVVTITGRQVVKPMQVNQCSNYMYLFYRFFSTQGIVKVKKSDDGGWKSKDKSLYLLYIEGNHVSNARRTSIQGDVKYTGND